MDINSSRLYLLAVIFLFVLTGCSHSHNPIAVDQGNTADAGDAIGNPVAQTPSMPSENGNRILWGYWDVRISPDDLTIEAIPDRASALHFNVVRLIEMTPCPYCLKIENIQWLPGKFVEADFRLQHPFPGMVNLTGFDVRGIFISEADYLFPETDRRIAYGSDIPRLLNPDGFTSLFNPTEFPEGTSPFPILGYITGKYSTGGPLSATLNPYIAYGTENPRRLFEAGSAETRKVRVQYSSHPVEFGYAVDASWFPAGDVIDPVTDFPPEANCPEAYRIEIMNQDPIELSSGASVGINLKIYDHQGIDSISCVTMESPDIFNGAVQCVLESVTGPDSWLFKGYVNSACGLADGTYPVLVRVENTAGDPNLGKIDSYQVFDVIVTDYFPGGWVRTWGAAVNHSDRFESACNFAITIDAMDSIYTGGWFTETVNLDPLCGDVRYSLGEHDACLVKMDTSGNYEWGRVWGGEQDENVIDIATDQAGNVYVTGRFKGSAFFAPELGEMRTSHGNSDVFLSRFDSSGNFLWVRTWGGTQEDDSSGVAVDGSDNVYVVGDFEGTVDFNPEGGDQRTAVGSDMYLIKYDTLGNYAWVYTWGGERSDTGNALAVDDSGYIYVTGRANAERYREAFLQKLDSDKNIIWTQTWGTYPNVAIPLGVAVGRYANVYLTGVYSGEIDFDPYGGDVHNDDTEGAIFLTMYSPNGNYRWTQTWGSWNQNAGLSVACDSTGNIFVSGQYCFECDMAPGGGEPHTPYGGIDAFLSKFSPLGHFRWVQTWGGPALNKPPIPAYSTEIGYSVAVDSVGNAYVVGRFTDPCIFSPDDPSCGNQPDIRFSMGEGDAYVVKYLPDGCW